MRGGLPRRRLDQVRGQAGGAMAPGSPNTFIGRIVVVYGPAGAVSGVFVYAPGTTPKLGNPPIASMTGGNKDPYNNPVTGGVESNNGAGQQVGMQGGAFVFDAAGDTRMFVTGGNLLTLFSSAASLAISMAVQDIFALQPGTVNVEETPHNMALANGWANVAGFATARYERVSSPPNSVWIQGVINAAAATSATFFTLPAGYVPSSASGFACGSNGGAIAGSAPNIRWDTAGNLSVNNATVPSASAFLFGGLIRLAA